MEEFAQLGLQKVVEYRKFKDMDYAKKCLEQNVLNTPKNRRFWEVYDLAMICFLMGNFENGLNFFEKFFSSFLLILAAGDDSLAKNPQTRKSPPDRPAGVFRMRVTGWFWV